MEEITVKLQYTLEDFMRAVPFAQQNTIFHKYWMAIFPIGVFLGIIRLIYAMSYEGDNLNYFAIFLIAAIPALLLFFVIFFLQKASPKTSKIDKISPLIAKHYLSKHLKSKPELTDEITLTFSDKGINYSNISFSEEIEWNSFKKALESETDIFLYTSFKNPQFIPKHIFDNGTQLNQIRELIKLKLGDKANFI